MKSLSETNKYRNKKCLQLSTWAPRAAYHPWSKLPGGPCLSLESGGDLKGKHDWNGFQSYILNHTSSVKRFSQNFDQEAVTYLIFFVGMHWFQKFPSPFWGRRGRWGQTTSKIKITKILNENPLKIDKIQNLASATSKMASATSRISEGAQWFFQKNTFFKSGQSTEKNEL